MTFSGPIWLASSSPRRRQLLAEAGWRATVCTPHVDDGLLRPGAVSPAVWVTALAYLKGRDVISRQGAQLAESGGTVLSADTVCVHQGDILGQPRDEAHARAMITRLTNELHHTLTGLSLIDARTGERLLFADATTVRVGELSGDQIDAYVESGEWRGKAGGYNLAERLEAGWPITCEGDPTTVMGLPMRRLHDLLNVPEADA